MKPARLPATAGRPLALLLPLALSACRIPADTPVAENQFGEAGALATSSERRLVLYDRARGRVVAEPDRDAIQELAGAVQDAFRSALEATDPVDRAERERRLADLLESSLSDAPARGGVALFRAGSWRLSEAYFNGVLEDADYAQLFELLFTRSADLVDLELRARGDDRAGARGPLGGATAAAVPATSTAPVAADPQSPQSSQSSPEAPVAEDASVATTADVRSPSAPALATTGSAGPVESGGAVRPVEATFRPEPGAPAPGPDPTPKGGGAPTDSPPGADPSVRPEREPAPCPGCPPARPTRAERLRGRVV